MTLDRRIIAPSNGPDGDDHYQHIATDKNEDKSSEPSLTRRGAYIQYVPRVQAFICKQGLLSVPNGIIERQAMLGIPNDRGESFLGHSESVGAMAGELAEKLSRKSEAYRIRECTRDLIATAGHLHDVGKTGPVSSINPNPVSFVNFYNVNYPFDPTSTTLREALIYAVSIGGISESDREYIRNVLKKEGRDPDRMYLRTFYNLHSLDTYAVLKEAGVDETIAAAAAGHHLKRGIKPDGYATRDLVETGRFIEPIDELLAMARLGNPKSGLPIRDRLLAVYLPFLSMDSIVGRTYSAVISEGLKSNILPEILENHPRQNP